MSSAIEVIAPSWEELEARIQQRFTRPIGLPVSNLSALLEAIRDEFPRLPQGVNEAACQRYLARGEKKRRQDEAKAHAKSLRR